LIPLPPYIKKPLDDDEKYQTVYSRTLGSIAAPTAGLHFTNELMAEIAYKRIEMVYLTLNIGPGTFKPIRVKQLEQHKMHYEKYSVDNSTLETIISAKDQGRRIVCVGTTTVRVLEHLAVLGELESNKELPINGVLDGQTDLFIYPSYKFQVVDALITNFHLPRSTLLMLVSAFAEQVGEKNDGIELIKESYRKAVEMNYRFYSFGDAMLII
jgi:S-adenosylmethionine:tRNA ribosyltransferase-isomerase